MSVVSTLRRTLRLAQAGGSPVLHWPRSARWPTRPTFDVFETVLTTALVPANAVWSAVGREAQAVGVLAAEPPAFVRSRRAAVKQFRDAGVEPTFEALTEATVRELGESGPGEDQLTRLMEIELAVTASFLYPIPTGCERLEAARRRSVDGRIIFISDIYLPSSFLRSRLAEHGCWQPGDRIWASSEAGRRKVDAGLFRLVRSYEDPGPLHRGRSLRFHHVGDRQLEDGTAARWAGFGSEVVTDAVPTQRELLLARSGHEDRPVWALFAGIARRTRLTTDGRDAPIDTAVRALGTEIAGPVVTSFCLWVLHEATTRGWSQVHVGPDAVLLQSMLADLARALDADLEVSVCPAWQEGMACSGGDGGSAAPVCGHVALRPRSAIPEFPAVAAPPEDASSPVDPGEVRYLYGNISVSGTPAVTVFLPAEAPPRSRDLVAVLLGAPSSDGQPSEGGIGGVLRRTVAEYGANLATALLPEYPAQVRPVEVAAYLERAAHHVGRSEAHMLAGLAEVSPGDRRAPVVSG